MPTVRGYIYVLAASSLLSTHSLSPRLVFQIFLAVFNCWQMDKQSQCASVYGVPSDISHNPKTLEVGVLSGFEIHSRTSTAAIKHVPFGIWGVVLVFHLSSGATSLNLDMDTLSAIMTGDITHWNDLRIQALNPSLTASSSLPNSPINSTSLLLFSSFLFLFSFCRSRCTLPASPLKFHFFLPPNHLPTFTSLYLVSLRSSE